MNTATYASAPVRNASLRLRWRIGRWEWQAKPETKNLGRDKT
jgi:hypothetical protein